MSEFLRSLVHGYGPINLEWSVPIIIFSIPIAFIAAMIIWPEDPLLQRGRGEDGYARVVLCVDGHPRKREQVHPHITYGGLEINPCCERDHFIPLGLCFEDWCDVAARNPHRPPTGADGVNPGNVWYQPWAEANAKDIEEQSLERRYCVGSIERMDAWQKLIDEWER